MLAEIGSRADDFCLAHVVVSQEDNLEKIADILVVIHNCSDGVDQMDNLLCHPVARCRLAAKDGDTRGNLLPLLGRHGLECEVTMDHTKDVELLTLVFVNSLHLNIEQGSWVYSNTS